MQQKNKPNFTEKDDVLITVKLTTAEQLSPKQRLKDGLPPTGLVVVEYSLSRSAMYDEWLEICGAHELGDDKASFERYMKYTIELVTSACNKMRQIK